MELLEDELGDSSPEAQYPSDQLLYLPYTKRSWTPYGFCHDGETEILTRNGWKRFADLDRTEDVATRSPDGRFEWQRPTAYTDEPYDGLMVQFTSQVYDALVTPNHRMLARYDRYGDGWQFREAKEFVGKTGKNWQFPATSTWDADGGHQAPTGRYVPYRGRIYCVTVPNGVIYTRRNGRPMWAGNSAIERAILPISIGLKRQEFLLDYFTEGTIPGVYVIAGDQYVTPAQQRQLQDTLNALAGDQAWKHRVIVLPPGSKTDPQKDLAWQSQVDQTITEQVAMILHIQPHEIGMVPGGKTSGLGGKGMAETQQRSIAESRTQPHRQWFKRTLFDWIIQRRFKQLDLEFKWVDFDQVDDEAKRAQADAADVNAGIRTIDEIRNDRGLEPYGLPLTSAPFLLSPGQPIPLDPVAKKALDAMNPAPNGPLGPDGQPLPPGTHHVDEQGKPMDAMGKPVPPGGLGPDGKPSLGPDGKPLPPGGKPPFGGAPSGPPSGPPAGPTAPAAKKPNPFAKADLDSEITKYSEDQERDDHGRFAGGGSDTATVHSPGDALSALRSGDSPNVMAADVPAVLLAAAKSDGPVDLTTLRVDGQQIFGGQGLGIARSDMPQIPTVYRQAFFDALAKDGVPVTHETVKPSDLKTIQREINADAVGRILPNISDPKVSGRSLISKDNYILDGNHTWAANRTVELSKPDWRIGVTRIGLDHTALLHFADKFDQDNGIAHRDIGSAAQAAAQAMAAMGKLLKYSEDQPRDDHGRFGEGSGGDTKPDAGGGNTTGAGSAGWLGMADRQTRDVYAARSVSAHGGRLHGSAEAQTAARHLTETSLCRIEIHGDRLTCSSHPDARVVLGTKGEADGAPVCMGAVRTSSAELTGVRKYSEDQPRDDHGRFGSGGDSKPDETFGPGHPDTQMMFSAGAPGVYAGERQELHNEIISNLLAHGIPTDHPILTMTGGGPASGKSYMVASGHVDLPSATVKIDPDAVKQQLPEYRAGIESGDLTAAAFTHEESSDIAKQAVSEGVGRGFNMMYDTTGDSSADKLAAKIDGWRQDAAVGGRTLTVNAEYATVPTHMALDLANGRASDPHDPSFGRHVPEATIRETHAAVSRTWTGSIQRGTFDRARLWDNSRLGQSRLIAEYNRSGGLQVHDQAAYDAFLAKANEGSGKVSAASLVKGKVRYKGDLHDVVHEYLLRSYPPDVVEWADDSHGDWEYRPHVALSEINMARRPGGRNPEKVQAIADSLGTGASLDPIVLVDTGNPAGLTIADGWHRTLGAEKAGHTDVPAFIGTGFAKYKDEINGPMQAESDSKKVALAELAVFRRYVRKGNDPTKFKSGILTADVLRQIVTDITADGPTAAFERARASIGKDMSLSAPLASGLVPFDLAGQQDTRCPKCSGPLTDGKCAKCGPAEIVKILLAIDAELARRVASTFATE